jgi:RNA recognition motif-containing protein
VAKKLFVGSLPWATTSDQLKEIFSKAGNVVSATVITDKFSGRSKGFGFVEMSTDEEASKAIAELNGMEVESPNGPRKIVVAEARPREEGGDRGSWQRPPAEPDVPAGEKDKPQENESASDEDK